MTTSQPDPFGDHVDKVAAADERATLEAFLDYLRDAVVRKARGVSEEDARRRLVPSATSLGGLVKHLRWVEMNWFQRVLAGTPAEALPPVPWTDGDPDAGGFRIEPRETLEQLVREYEEECARSRATAAGYRLEDTGQHRHMGTVSLRWIYLHMIEETGRHAGHADILREQTDGVTGD